MLLENIVDKAQLMKLELCACACACLDLQVHPSSCSLIYSHLLLCLFRRGQCKNVLWLRAFLDG